MRLSLVLYAALAGLTAANAVADGKDGGKGVSNNNYNNNKGHDNKGHDNNNNNNNKGYDNKGHDNNNNNNNKGHNNNNQGYDHGKDDHKNDHKDDHKYDHKDDHNNKNDYNHQKNVQKYEPHQEYKSVEYYKKPERKVRYYCKETEHQLYCCNGRKWWSNGDKKWGYEVNKCEKYTGYEDSCQSTYYKSCCQDYADENGNHHCSKCFEADAHY